MDIVGGSRSRIGQKALSGIPVLSGRNSFKHPCKQTTQIAGWRPCDPASLSAKPHPLRILPDKEGQGSRAGLGGDHRLGEEALPRHGEISTSRPSLTASVDRQQALGRKTGEPSSPSCSV